MKIMYVGSNMSDNKSIYRPTIEQQAQGRESTKTKNNNNIGNIYNA